MREDSGWLGERGDLLQLVHRHDALGEFIRGFERLVHLDQIFVHFREVLVNELVHDLRRKVDPDVQDSIFCLVFEGLEKVLLDVADDGVRATKVQLVPLPIRLSVSDALLANRSIGQQVVNEFDGEHLDLVVLFEAADVDVIALRDVQEDAVDEEQERFYVQELAPTETEVKEELGQSLVIDAFSVELLHFALLAEGFQLASLLKSSFLFSVHEPLIFFIKLLTRLVF